MQGVAMTEHDHGAEARERGDSPDRQIEAAQDHHERHSDRDDPDDIALMAVEAADESAARAAFAADPWTVHGIFRLKDVRRWMIWLDGRAARA